MKRLRGAAEPRWMVVNPPKWLPMEKVFEDLKDAKLKAHPFIYVRSGDLKSKLIGD